MEEPQTIHEPEDDQLEESAVQAPREAPSAREDAQRAWEDEPAPPRRSVQTTAHGLPRRRPMLAAFFSLVPGLGNVYNGLYVRGFSMFAVIWLLISFTAAERGDPAPFTVPLIVFLMFFNILDAYRQAVLINAGGIVDLGLNDLPNFEKLAGSALLPGAVIALVGLYGAFRVYLNTDFGWLLNHWPIPLMLFGGWLTWQALRSQKAAASSQM